MAVYRRGNKWWISHTVNGERVQKGVGTVNRNAEAFLEKIRVEMRAGRYVDPEISAIPFERMAIEKLSASYGAEGCYKSAANVEGATG